jgi:Arc/MetJ-type ribon-helix-helix transcriptional regulator
VVLWRRTAQNIATTDGIDKLVDAWIKEGRFANRSEAFRAGIFALKEKLEAETFDPDYVTIVRELDRHEGGLR